MKKNKKFPRGKISKKWKWIVRDEDNALCLFEKKPMKCLDGGFWCNGITTQDGELIRFSVEAQQLMSDDYKDIKWEDDKPTLIEG